MKICRKSLADQTCQDFEHIIIVDEVGRGIPWANRQLAERDWSDLSGQYVYILDDDNMMMPGAIGAIKHELVAADLPALMICRVHRIQPKLRGIPKDEYWEKGPVLNTIDAGCVVVRHDLFLKAVKSYPEIYTGDYDYILAAYTMAESVKWYKKLIMRAQGISLKDVEL